MRGTVIFDESGFLSAEMMKVYGAFAIVNKSFKTGKDRDGNSLDHSSQSPSSALLLIKDKWYFPSSPK